MSKIEVNKIGPQCGTTLTVGCGAGQTVAVDANTVTLGRCGGTVALASGATQSGFGRTGTVDWQTGSIKTTTFTATSGEGYFVDTSSGGVTANLPAGTAGAIVSFADYTRTFQTNALTVSPNGSNKIGGVNADATVSTEGQSVTFVFVDATEGWINVQDSTSAVQGRVVTSFIIATGGTETDSGDCRIHTFTGPGTFCVTNEGVGANQVVSHLVVAGGGGGGHDDGGGGGAGGFRENESPVTPYTQSPLAGGTAVTISSIGGIPVTVGAGGTAGIPGVGTGFAGSGSNSIFSTITSTGGGFGARSQPCSGGGGPGGSGGGADAQRSGGTGNTPPVSPAQGSDGGAGTPGGNAAGGGGGATNCGSNGSGTSTSGNAGPGGAGATTSISGSPTAYAGGGGGGGYNSFGTGGTGGGGNGMSHSSPSVGSGTANTGGGGGGGSTNPGPRGGGAGGSGIVIIRYKRQ